MPEQSATTSQTETSQSTSTTTTPPGQPNQNQNTPPPEEGKTLLNVEGKTEAKTEESKTDAKPVVPEKYEFKAPQEWADKGWELDDAIVDRATPMFKELGLTNDQAQKLVEFYAKESQADYERNLQTIKDQSDNWLKELKADPEIGGKLEKVKEDVGRLYDSLGNPTLVSAFKEQMETTGIGNNPAFVRFMSALASRFTEGKPVKAGNPVNVTSPTGQRPTIAEAIYGPAGPAKGPVRG